MRITKTIMPGILLLIAHAVSYGAAHEVDVNVCNKYSTAKSKLMSIYNEYSSLPKNSDNAETLYLLYRRLERTVKEAQALYPADYNRNADQYVVISDCLWDSGFQEIGLSIGHYSDRLEYSEHLMTEAHFLNPYTKYRSYTLYTEIYGKGGQDFGFPDVEKARSYLKEFPDGPQVIRVYEILAGFYHDLYAALRAIEKEPNENERGETYSCYDEYIAKHPEEAKQGHARKMGIFYFEKVITATSPKDVKRRMYVDELDALKKGNTDNVVNVCGD